MDLKEYSETALSTAIYDKSTGYPVLGLVGETGELIRKFNSCSDDEEINKEIGDVFWYLNAISSDYLYMNLYQLVRLNDQVSVKTSFSLGAWNKVSKIAEIAKKAIRDSNNTLNKTQSSKLSLLLVQLYRMLENYASHELDDILQLNHDKLFSRKERGVISGSGDNR